MSITVAFGRWGLPYLICIGRWEWICFRSADRRWRIEHFGCGQIISIESTFIPVLAQVAGTYDVGRHVPCPIARLIIDEQAQAILDGGKGQ